MPPTPAKDRSAVTEPPEAVFEALTLQSRCDECRAQGFMRFTLGNLELIFCGHHGNKYAIDLELKGFKIETDNREFINKAPSPSANIGPETMIQEAD